MEQQEMILSDLTPFEKSRQIWTAVYQSMGLKLPDLFTKKLEETQMADSIEDRKTDILIALEAWIVDNCRSLDTNRGNGDDNAERTILDQYPKSANRLEQLINRNLVPYVKRGRDGKIVFFRQVIMDLQHYGLKHLDLPSLQDAISGAEYAKTNGHNVVKFTIQNLFDQGDG
jgi:hypothetical protein